MISHQVHKATLGRQLERYDVDTNDHSIVIFNE